MIDLVAQKKLIMDGLKDFQRATVQRVDDLFQGGFHRVLVADEVGLGKTLVAKGVIATIASRHQQSKKTSLLKVVYICSNQSIAGQNLRKLKVHSQVNVDGLADTRLSMQHLKIHQQMNDQTIRDGLVQLIPLTPATSFSMTSGSGSVRERALIYAIIRRMDLFSNDLAQLEELMVSYATVSWPYYQHIYEEQIEIVNQESNGAYLEYMIDAVNRRVKRDPDFLALAKQVFASIAEVGYRQTQGANHLILKFRKMMAEISVGMMDADLVILDEFQRFPELIEIDEDNETAMLAKRFFSAGGRRDHQPLILLLSATPYKLYSTMEEIRDNRRDEHYVEFMKVVKFLFEHQQEQRENFVTTWKNYSVSLNEATYGDFAMIVARKSEAENILYQGICRTERMKVPGAMDLIDVETRNGNLEITVDDVLAYAELHRVLEELDLTGSAPIEYIKSAPLVMSFMQHYKLKQNLLEHLKKVPDLVPKLFSQRLWVIPRRVARYQDLKIKHARYNRLKELSLPPQAQMMMWIPPSRPYYEFGGPFQNQEGFSKTLVFSAWEMVPRSIAALLSYEAERLTVGELVRKTPKSSNENRSYFAKVRFPAPRIRFAVKNDEPENMNHLCLLYPSISLAKLYDPIDCMNQKLELEGIEQKLRFSIHDHLNKLQQQITRTDLRQDERWYYMAPLLMDLNQPQIQGWLQNPLLKSLDDESDGVEQSSVDAGNLLKHLQHLKSLYHSPEQIDLGRMPDDLEEVLIWTAMASPAVCAVRMLGIESPQVVDMALQLAKTVVDRFNTQESIAMVELSYDEGSESAHWKNILRYCRDGNLQSSLDEYAHMLLDGYDYVHWNVEERNSVLVRDMIHTLKTHTASYHVDTYGRFRDQIIPPESKRKRERYIKMRSNYAVGFYDTKGEGKSVQRKDNIRLSFNSPFRPFVLATTSIGQEGLDFHYYCRNIVHWNLPGNPVDLEQREGRINRYKCHAIRQNIAHKYGHIPFSSDIWEEMFTYAQEMESNKSTSDLVPYWCLPETNEKELPYKIQRVVPIYPLSRDSIRYQRLIKILSLYRLSLGQARQEELIEYFFENGIDDVGDLFMNLSPYFKNSSHIQGESPLGVDEIVGTVHDDIAALSSE